MSPKTFTTAGKAASASALALLALALAAPGAAAIQNGWKQSSSVWQQMDKCNRAAIKAFPDYTRESLAKREAYRRNCLRQANLPDGNDAPPPSR
jgi:hypothetical protein